MTVKLYLKKAPRVPVNAENIVPHKFTGKSLNEIGELGLLEGNHKLALRSLFKLEESSEKTLAEMHIHLKGDLSKFRNIGTGMMDGEIFVQGDVGMYVGEEMKGGRITIEGNAGSWAGSAMKGGQIEVLKNAGDYVGGAYRGSNKGMQGGIIIIHGDAGVEVGGHMRKGLIKVLGNVDQFLGIRMKKGTILIRGNTGERPGAFMTGGKIILCNHVSSILPTFMIDNIKSKVKAVGEEIPGPFYLFVGDHAEHGNGRLYVSKSKNKYLEKYEALL
ncbi:MAG: formylmethanofuran dehydrogenase subunit C [Candidatus Bathyarchaeota archaeon]|nr:MAG: formylmethanofuran dehydrogenase subunit C [Candidatus Bathyarchaeota archaeon]